MNKSLKQAIYKKECYLPNYRSVKNSKNWDKFRQRRYLVTKLIRKSVNKCLIEMCVGGRKSKDF